MKVKHIEKFLFDTAIYNISDKRGRFVRLKVDYRNKRFELEGLQQQDNAFIQEVTDIANDLLARKSGINIAEPVAG